MVKHRVYIQRDHDPLEGTAPPGLFVFVAHGRGRAAGDMRGFSGQAESRGHVTAFRFAIEEGGPVGL